LGRGAFGGGELEKRQIAMRVAAKEFGGKFFAVGQDDLDLIRLNYMAGGQDQAGSGEHPRGWEARAGVHSDQRSASGLHGVGQTSGEGFQF
jgi:hypothetical protein